MFIKFLRSSFAIQYVTLVVLATVLWLPSFLNPLPAVEPDGFNPLYALLYSWIAPYPLITTIIAFLLLIFQAFYLNAILSNNLLIGRVASGGAFVYVLLMSLTPQQTILYPLLLAMPFVLVSIQTIFNCYDTTENEWNIFNIAFFISLGSMIYFPLIVLIVWLYASLFTLRIIKFREWLIPIIGMLIPLIFLSTYYFLMNVFIAKALAYSAISKMLVIQPEMPGLLAITIIIVVIWMFLHAIGLAYGRDADRNIATSKKKSILIMLLLFSFAFLLYRSPSIIQQSLFLLPIAVFISFSYMVVKKFFWPQLLLFSLIILSFISHYLIFLQ